MDRYEFLKEVNKLRKENQDKWVFWDGEVEGKYIYYKAFNTWIQKLYIGDILYDSTMDCSVKEFKDSILQAFEDYDKRNSINVR